MKRMNIKTLPLLLTLSLLAGCSPKVTSILSGTRPALGADEEVVVVEVSDPDPEDAVFVGSIEIGDSGFTTNKNGTYESVLSIARERARRAGGNVVRIVEHRRPDRKSSIHRIRAAILWVPDTGALAQERGPVVQSSHPDYAVIYLYWDSADASLVSYDVHLGDSKVYRARPGSRAEVKVYEGGDFELWARTEVKVRLPLHIDLGGEYYVRCSVDMGAFIGHPSMVEVPASFGGPEYEMIEVKK